MPLIVQSLRLWRDMDRLTEASTGFRECGVLYVGESEADERRFVEWQAMAAPYDVGARSVNGAGLQRSCPARAAITRAGCTCPPMAVRNRSVPLRRLPAPRSARARSSSITAPYAASNGPAGVSRPSSPSAAVSAATPSFSRAARWSSLFCASLGIRLPQLKVLSSVMRTAPVGAGAPIRAPIWMTSPTASGGRRLYDCPRRRVRRALRARFPAVLSRISGRTIRKERAALRVRVNAQSLREFRSPWRGAWTGPVRSKRAGARSGAE